MSKHCSPAKKLRSSKRLINYLLMKRKLNLAINFLPPTSTFPARNVLSISHQSSWSLSPSTKLLARSKPVLTDFPPDPKKTIHLETYQELISKYTNLQSAIIQAENGFNEIIKLKDDHIQFLKFEIQNIPALVLSQLQHLHPT